MATSFGIHLAVAPGDEARARDAVGRCVTWLCEVDDRLTRFDAASELCQLNAAAGRWQPVSKLLYDALAQSLAAARATDGLFDPTLLAVLKVLGYDRDYAEIAEREVGPLRVRGRRPARAGGWRGIELDRARRRVRLPRGAELDLGGIAKGWAADVAVTRFFGPFAHVLVDAGGDMRARGGPEEGGLWALGIGDPFRDVPGDHPLAVLTLGRGGLATSGAGMRLWSQGGQRRHHLIDPRTERAARVWAGDEANDADGTPLIATASALAPSAAHAEVAAKVALLRGYPQALRAVEQAWASGEHSTSTPRPYTDSGVALILVLGTGEVVCSANLTEYLATLGGGGEIWLD